MAKRANFSIDSKVLEDFRKACKENYINQSAFITSKMLEFVKECEEKEGKK
ncbi:MAG: hypothetical protein KGD70_14570 [Candidatus Lokiarchaeota archaeon]|nr:hypothetical protein [Candidatus Lokiarchaeota archaeon]